MVVEQFDVIACLAHGVQVPPHLREAEIEYPGRGEARATASTLTASRMRLRDRPS